MKKIFLSILALIVLFVFIVILNFIIFQQTVNEVSKGKPIAQIDSSKQALMIIDIQEATTGNSSEYEFFKLKSEELIRTVNLLADSSAKYQVPVIYIKSVINNFLLNMLNDSYAPDSPGSKFDTRLKLVSNNIFTKDKADAFSNSALDSFLIKNEINKIVFTGLDLAECVDKTILAAANRKYNICILQDAVLSKSDSLKQAKLVEFKEKGFEIISSDEYIIQLNQ